MKNYERSRKGSQLDTIHYEIDMLEYAFLKPKSDLPLPELNMVVECFLMHYRNLIEFFKDAKPRKRDGKRHTSDLSITKPEVWCGRKLTEKELEVFANATLLSVQHWTDISQFLQHCTERRFHEFREWHIQEMWDKLEPIVKFFRESFPRTTISDVKIVGALRRTQSTTPFSVAVAPMISKE